MHIRQLTKSPFAVLGFATACLSQEIFYDETWAGPVRLAPNVASISPTSLGFTTVEATLVMPCLSIPENPSQLVDQYRASFWIGLDGFLPSTETPASTVRGLWQAGVFMSIWENGTTSYTGFHEW